MTWDSVVVWKGERERERGRRISGPSGCDPCFSRVIQMKDGGVQRVIRDGLYSYRQMIKQDPFVYVWEKLKEETGKRKGGDA